MDAIAACGSPTAVEDFYTVFLLDNARDLPGDWASDARNACDDRISDLQIEEANRAMDSEVGEIARFG